MSAWKSITQQVNYTLKHVSPLVCEVHLPGGLPYEAFDSAVSKVKPKSLLLAFESSRMGSVFHKERKSYLEVEILLKDKILFLASIQMQVQPEIYLKESPKYPLNITNSMSYLGKSSKRITSILASSPEGTQYAQFDAQDVLIDPVTRKPSSFPDWWMEKYGNLKPEEGKPLKIAEVKRPSTCLCYEFPVHPQDCDSYQHTNWMSYGSFCYDACWVFIRKSQYRRLNGDVFNNGLKSISVSFRQESSELEVLTLYSWEDELIPHKVYFEIQNQQEKTCCYAIIEFFSESPENMVSMRRTGTKL